MEIADALKARDQAVGPLESQGLPRGLRRACDHHRTGGGSPAEARLGPAAGRIEVGEVDGGEVEETGRSGPELDEHRQ